MQAPIAHTSNAHIDELFAEIDSLLSDCDLDYLQKRTRELVSKIALLDAVEQRDARDSHVALARQAQEIMAAHVRDPLTIPEIAHECGTSPTMLKQTFRSVVGIPIYQWYRGHRIGCAQDLLSKTSLPVSQVASAVGYTNPSKFASAFRNETGESPREWRATRGL